MKKGFTLVEAMIFMLILSVVTVSFYRTLSGGMKVLSDSKARIAATQVATERFETLRNLAYEDLGTPGGNPNGLVQKDITMDRSGVSFNVHTEIRYSDDDYDNATSDSRPNDYKQVEVSVSWGDPADNKKVNMTTHMAPPGTEELYNGGILSIEIRRSDGTPVPGAEVKVTDMTTGMLKSTEYSSVEGKVYLIGYEPGDKRYKITVKKAGYYDVATMPPYNQTAYDPVDEHGTVVLAGIWHQTIILDLKASLSIKTEDPLGTAIGDIAFSLEGGRKLGDTVPDAIPVYSYPKANKQTDASGMFSLTGESAGKYIFGWPNPAAGKNADYEFWKMSPMYGTEAKSFFANPGDTEVSALLVPKNTPALFLTVVDQADNNPISEAIVTVKNESLGYEKSDKTDQFGKVYFPKKEDPAVPIQQGAEYEVSVQAAGYQNQTTNITVSDLTEQTVQIHL